jgi:hypothetical protein
MCQILQTTVTANHTSAAQLQMHQAVLVLVHAARTQSEAPKACSAQFVGQTP